MLTPNKTIGILGGGQLARMLAIEAKTMGYQVAILEKDNNAPAKYFADHHLQYAYDEVTGLHKIAILADVVTTEFENVPANTLSVLAPLVAVHPNAKAITIAQNRILEKAFFQDMGLDTTDCVEINSDTDCTTIDKSMFPAILKTASMGYDGKGQVYVSSLSELASKYKNLNFPQCILEKLVELQLEVSAIVARNNHETVVYPIAENIHHNGILDITIAPARISVELSDKIKQIAIEVADKLNYIGTLAIEFFITTDNKILVNEMAPRPHNSGHYTIDACITSQFGQQLRAICGLKLGSTHQHSKAVMLNLLGDIWIDNQLPCAEILAKYDNLKLHLYDKVQAKPGRKMGHLTVLGNDVGLLLKQVDHIKKELNFK